MILELTQTIWLMTPKGQALAKFLIDRGDESDLQWVCFHENGECWTWMNPEVRASDNRTMGRVKKFTKDSIKDYLKDPNIYTPKED